MFTVKEKNVLVIGLGLSGIAAAHFLIEQGAHVYGVDKNINTPEIAILQTMGMSVGVDTAFCNLNAFDLVVVSPGIPQTHPLYQSAQKLGLEVIGEVELGCRFIRQPMVGITGTNGKTTVTLLVTHVLNYCGKSARALGNVGAPLTREITNASPDDILVVELSSYQLETLSCRVLDAAVILNVTPDHLDRYGIMEAYARAKFCIYNCLKQGVPLYVERETMKRFGVLFSNIPVKTYGYLQDDDISTDLTYLFINQKSTVALPYAYQGKKSHDLENVMAAYALCQGMGVTNDQFFLALESFKKPSHRIEFVCQRHGVSYYDDSKGTNIDAVIRAVEQMPGRVVLIAGGVDKGSAYTPWIKEFRQKVIGICAIGQAAEKIQRDLSHAIPVKIYGSLDEALVGAVGLAQTGDSVLLSPGCSSYDMFRDYVHRGNEFQRLVHLLD